MLKVEGENLDELVGKWRVAEKNENDDNLVDACGERGLVLVNTCCKLKKNYRYTWRRYYVQNEGNC